MRHRGRLLNRAQLLDLAWGPGTFVTDHVVDNHVVALHAGCSEEVAWTWP